MFAEFVASTQYARYVGNDPRHSALMMECLISAENCALFVVDAEDGVIGMLGLMVFVQPFSGETVASELFWWLDPQHRGHGVWLLRRGEKWAKDRGATRMSMMAPIDKPRVAAIYSAVGYTEVERVFQRDL
jgi:GNAT superfamily N-acetyltransferase